MGLFGPKTKADYLKAIEREMKYLASAQNELNWARARSDGSIGAKQNIAIRKSTVDRCKADIARLKLEMKSAPK